jgi:hypothetical protein
LARLGVEPGSATVAFSDLLDECQSDAAALKFCALVQSRKHLEDAVGITGLDADAVVFYAEVPRFVT